MTLAVMLTRSPANGQLARRDRGLAIGAVAACWVSERTTALRSGKLVRLDHIAARAGCAYLKNLRVSRYPTVWDEIDLAAGVWTVPAARMKTPREHRVPLSVAALKIRAMNVGT